jgi:hypothetical protein
VVIESWKVALAEVIGKIWDNHIFVVDIPWKRTGKAPQNKQEAYEMAVKGILPKEYKAYDDET